MGLFSYDCKGCGHSLRRWGFGPEWMNAGVAVLPSGKVREGSYDGYGRLDGWDIPAKPGVAAKASIYHHTCWEILGQPGYDGPSDHSSDQGGLTGGGNPREPSTKSDLRKMLAVVEAQKKRARDEYLAWERKQARKRR